MRQLNQQKKGYISCIFGPKRIYVLQQLDEGVAYNMPAVLELEGALDVAKLSAVCKELISRHEPLRTSFVSELMTSRFSVSTPKCRLR